jgi:APA family basic amino acid/polyamine antiporter
VGAVVSIVAGFTPISLLGDMTSFGTLFAFTMVCLAVWILRFRDPNRDRPFKVSGLNIVAPLGILVNTFLILNLGRTAQVFALAWLVFGLVVYFLYGRPKSHLNTRE